MERESLFTGCYLLVILAEPICEDHKEKIIQRVAKGLLSWNTIETECDLKEIENAINNKDKSRRDDSPEILLQHSTEKLAVEVLLSPSVSTLKQCVKNMFLSPTAHKHLIHGGYSFTGTGSWMLDDGLFSFDDFVETLEDNSIRNFLESYSDSMFTFHIHCSPVGQWVTNDLKAQSFSKYIRIELNPSDSPSGVQGAATLLDFLDESLKHLNLDSKMSSTDFIGNIRFNRPTLYVFPSGQGDCCLFGVSGFTMLIDGGFTPFPSFWNFIRHLERLDAIMVTRLSEDNLWGVSSLFKKKILRPIYPQIGYIFCNIAESIPDLDKKPNDSNELLVSVIGIGQEFLGNVKQIGLNPLQCLREPLDSIEPMTLYHKVGLGTLQMFILSPPRDNKILKEFLNHWSSGKESFSLVRTGSASHKRSDVAIPLSNLMSICCLLVWKPSDPNEEITRMLFPGSAPQSRIFEGLNKIQKLDIFCQQKCTQSSIKTNFQTKDVKSSKPNRFRSVSPISRIKPFNVRQHSTETEKNKTVEEKEDINYISNNYKQKSIKQIPPLNKSEKKESPKESAKKIVSNTKTDKSPKTEVLPEKRSVTQSPKKITKSKKLSQTKPISKKGETQKKLNLNLNENQKQINESIVKAVNQKRESLERENEIQNKLLHSEYLKEDIEPDSLESVITDGKISKDSLEVSEDEISSEKFFIQTDIIEEEELKSSMTTISPEMNVSVIESKFEENSSLINENEDKKDVFDSTVETMDTNLENNSEKLNIQLEKHDIMESNIDAVSEVIDSKQFEAEDTSGDQKQFEGSVEMSEKRSSISGKTDKHQSICDDSICLDNKSLEKGSDEIEILKENLKDSDQLSIEDPINKLEFKDVSKDLVLSEEYDSNDLEKESLNESQKLIDQMLLTNTQSKEYEIIKSEIHTEIDLTEKDQGLNKNESIVLKVKSEKLEKSDKPINFQVSTDDLNKIKDEKEVDDKDLNETEVIYSLEESKYTKVNENIIGLNDDKIGDEKEKVETLKMETKDLTENKSQLESELTFNESKTDDTKDLTKEPEIKNTDDSNVINIEKESKQIKTSLKDSKDIEIKDFDKDLEVLEIENKENDLIKSEVRVDENKLKYGLLEGYVEIETKELSEHTNDMKIIEEQTIPNQMEVLKSEKTTKDGDFSETKKESVKQDLTHSTIEPKIESFENKNQKVPEESKIEISIEYDNKLEIKDSVKDTDNQQNQQKSIKSKTEKIDREMYPSLEDTVFKDSPKDKNETQFEDSMKETKDSVEFEFKEDLKKLEIKETDEQRVKDTEKGLEKSEKSIDNNILFVEPPKNETKLEETDINTFGNMTKLEKDKTSIVFKAENESKELLKKSEEIECSIKQTNELEMKVSDKDIQKDQIQSNMFSIKNENQPNIEFSSEVKIKDSNKESKVTENQLLFDKSNDSTLSGNISTIESEYIKQLDKELIATDLKTNEQGDFLDSTKQQQTKDLLKETKERKDKEIVKSDIKYLADELREADMKDANQSKIKDSIIESQEVKDCLDHSNNINLDHKMNHQLEQGQTSESDIKVDESNKTFKTSNEQQFIDFTKITKESELRHLDKDLKQNQSQEKLDSIKESETKHLSKQSSEVTNLEPSLTNQLENIKISKELEYQESNQLFITTDEQESKANIQSSIKDLGKELKGAHFKNGNKESIEKNDYSEDIKESLIRRDNENIEDSLKTSDIQYIKTFDKSIKEMETNIFKETKENEFKDLKQQEFDDSNKKNNLKDKRDSLSQPISGDYNTLIKTTEQQKISDNKDSIKNENQPNIEFSSEVIIKDSFKESKENEMKEMSDKNQQTIKDSSKQLIETQNDYSLKDKTQSEIKELEEMRFKHISDDIKDSKTEVLSKESKVLMSSDQLSNNQLEKVKDMENVLNKDKKDSLKLTEELEFLMKEPNKQSEMKSSEELQTVNLSIEKTTESDLNISLDESKTTDLFKDVLEIKDSAKDLSIIQISSEVLKEQEIQKSSEFLKESNITESTKDLKETEINKSFQSIQSETHTKLDSIEDTKTQSVIKDITKESKNIETKDSFNIKNESKNEPKEIEANISTIEIQIKDSKIDKKDDNPLKDAKESQMIISGQESVNSGLVSTNEFENIKVTDIYSKESHTTVQSIEPKEDVSKKIQLSIEEEKSETEFKSLDKNLDFKQHLTEPETKELLKENQLMTTSSTKSEIDSKSTETIDNSNKIKKFDGIFSDLNQSRDSDQSIRSSEEKSICGVDDSKADKYLYSESSIIDIKSDDDFGNLSLISTNVVSESKLFKEEMKNPNEFSNNNSKSEILRISSDDQTFNTDIQIEVNSNKNTNQTNKGVVNISENLRETEPIITSKTEEKTLSISSTNGSKQSNEESIVKEFKDNKANDKQISAGNESKTVHSLPSTHVRRTSHVVEQPLYEDSDEEDNRSKQMTEQIITSNTLSADYPELISLSGGTTPSQSAPQSPHDSKSLSRSESLKSKEKIIIIDTIPEDKDNEKQNQNSDINVTQIEMKSEKSKTTPKSNDQKLMETSGSDKSLIESTSQQKEIKSSQMSIELKDNKSNDDLKTKTTLKESSETEVVIIEATESGDNKFNSDQWGRPLSLPTPPDTTESKVLNKTNVIKSNPTNSQKFSKPGKKLNGIESSGNAIYLELAYVPHHADQHYCNADYFKRVRAKYYVFSGINPHREVFEALIEGKKVWDKQFITTVVPTHESESLGFWINNNRNLLEEYMIAVAPAADRCTVNLQDYQTKCSAYRVEF